MACWGTIACPEGRRVFGHEAIHTTKGKGRMRDGMLFAGWDGGATGDLDMVHACERPCVFAKCLSQLSAYLGSKYFTGGAVALLPVSLEER